MKYKIRGDKALIKRLKNVSIKGNEQVKASVVRNTEQIYEQALANAPIDTGDLKRSGIKSFADNMLTGNVAFGGSLAPYAPYVEFGTGSNVSIPSGLEDFARQFYVNGEGRMKAQPFLFPAYFKYRKQFQADIRKIFKGLTK